MHTQCNPDANAPKLPSRFQRYAVHDRRMTWNRCQRQYLAGSVSAKAALEAAGGNVRKRPANRREWLPR